MLRGSRPVLMVIGITLVLSAGSVIHGPRASAEPPLPIRIGYQPDTDWVLFAAKELKTFEQEGLSPTYVRFEAGRPMIAAAESRSIDVSAVGMTHRSSRLRAASLGCAGPVDGAPMCAPSSSTAEATCPLWCGDQSVDPTVTRRGRTDSKGEEGDRRVDLSLSIWQDRRDGTVLIRAGGRPAMSSRRHVSCPLRRELEGALPTR